MTPRTDPLSSGGFLIRRRPGSISRHGRTSIKRSGQESDEPDLHTAIVGTINPDHLNENLRVLEKGPLPPDLYAEAKRRLDSAGA